TLVMAPRGGDFEPPELVDVVVKHGVTVLQFVPSLLGLWLDEPTTSRCQTVRHVFCAGAALAPALRDRFFDRFERTALYNVYGPTETCICSVMYRCERSPTALVPIGRPVANTQLYVLGRDLTLSPIGAAGELYIAGDGLARGYINRPDLTAERFIANPFPGTAGARMYKTGDRVRYLPDGNVEFLGRDDEQVKIRGVRIELQEVGATLARHPAIQQAVVVARNDATGDPQLAAYYVTRETNPTGDELRRFLRHTLPASAVPAWLVRLEALPLAPNGKIDRRALPEPRRSAPAERLLQPRTDVERTLTRIWSEVLQVAPIGVNEDFFELGGHSLLATQVISRIHREFGRRVPLRHLFESATIEALAKIIEGEPPLGQQGPVPIIRRAARRVSP
ncbi:MAG: non-ribosomal peptide synthetase, partial [Vicinamibacterales bacterium]